MEYPFKDLMPLDEVLEREGYYKDWTHLDPEVFYSLTQISNFIKTKGYGVDVRLLIAQLAEHFGLKTTQVVDLGNLLTAKHATLKTQFEQAVSQVNADRNALETQFNQSVAQMQAEKDAVIANATVDSEVILARGGKPTLQARLDDTATQLAQKANILNVDFGELELPNDFPSLPFKLFAIDENTVEHDFDINSYKVGAGSVYLDYTAPPSRNGLTPETSVKHLYQALDIAESMPQSTVIIYVMNKYYPRNYNGVNGTRTLTKNIIFSPYQREKSFIGSFEDPTLLTWVAEGKAYKTSRSATNSILDLAVKFKGNEPTKYNKVSSVAEVQAKEGTFCIVGSDVWVRRIGDKAPDDDLMVLMDIGNPSFSINDKKLIFDRVSWFWFYDSTPSDGLKVTGNANSELVLYKSSFAQQKKSV